MTSCTRHTATCALMPELPIPAVPGIKATGWLVLEATRYAGGQARDEAAPYHSDPAVALRHRCS